MSNVDIVPYATYFDLELDNGIKTSINLSNNDKNIHFVVPFLSNLGSYGMDFSFFI